jgi:hypothetical protein
MKNKFNIVPNTPLFIVTSSLKPSIGVFDDQQRFFQTINTFDSIRKKCPNSNILFVDASTREISINDLNIISNNVDYFIKFDEKNNKDIIELSRMGMKSQAETLMLYTVMAQLKVNPTLQKLIYSTSRIFKMSGRMELNDGFNIKSYNDTFGKYVFRKRLPSWMNKPRISDYLFTTRLFSLCPSLIDNYMEVLRKNFELLNYVDTEHAHFKNIPEEYLVEFHTVYCKGQVASTGNWEYD